MSAIRILGCWAFLVATVSPLVCAGAEAPAKFDVGGLTFARPSTWEWVPVTSAMRKAELRVADEKTKQKAEIVFFSGFGGGVKANVDRWFGQFQEPRENIQAKTEEVSVGKHKVTYASAQGTYMSGMPGGARTPLKDHALLGAIIEHPSGDIFIRMTGPIDLVQKAGADFRKMVESAVK